MVSLQNIKLSMKANLIIVISLFVAVITEAQVKKPVFTLPPPTVDQRVEIVSIAARLAEYQEYNSDVNKAYVQDIHKYFDKYKQHALINYLREIRHTNSLSYDAVMAMAVHLTPPPDLNPVVDFNSNVPEARWGKLAATKFTGLLQQFYYETNASLFFNNHKAGYDLATARIGKVFKQLDVNWFQQYYGVKPASRFNVIVAPGNGGANYSTQVNYPNGTAISYAILGTWKLDDNGEPDYTSAAYLPTLIHEFNHSFVNYLTAKNEASLYIAGKILYQSDSAKMQSQAYGDWKIMLNESLVRASVIRYLMSHNTNPAVADREMKLQLSKGFVWIRQLTELLGIYEKNRKRYPTLESFMPQLIKFYNITATNISSIQSDYNKKLAHVSAIKPFNNGDNKVNAQLTTIKVYFDKPLSGEGVSITWGKGTNQHYPITRFLGYTNNNTAITLAVALQPGLDYQFILTGASFQTPDGYPLQDYEVHFKTAQ